MYANECAGRHAIFMKLKHGQFRNSRGIPGRLDGFRARLRDGFRMNEVSATNAETERRPRRLIDFTCNARCTYRESYRAHLLLAVHPHITPRFNPISPFFSEN